jgi:hypothetical protein
VEAQPINGTGFEPTPAAVQISGYVFSGLVQGAILGSPDFLFLQAAMEPLDGAVAFWMMVGRAAMRDAK